MIETLVQTTETMHTIRTMRAIYAVEFFGSISWNGSGRNFGSITDLIVSFTRTHANKNTLTKQSSLVYIIGYFVVLMILHVVVIIMTK